MFTWNCFVKKGFVLIFSMFFTVVMLSQNNEQLDKLYRQYSKGESCYKAINTLLNKSNFDDLTGYFELKLETGSSDEKLFTVSILGQLASQLKDESQLQKCTHLLISKGLIAKESSVAYYTLGVLEQIPVSGYNAANKSLLASHIIGKPLYFGRLAKLAAYAQVSDLVSYFEMALTSADSIDRNDFWSLNVALARMGNLNCVDYCTSTIDKIGVNDQTIQLLLPDIVFMHQKKGIDYILNLILNDNFNCTNTNPDNEAPINCAYRLLELVAPVICDFPIKSNASGDLQTTDYAEALKISRTWIINNYDTYQTCF